MSDLFTASYPSELPRGRRILVRTARGVELGEVVVTRTTAQAVVPPVRVLRPTTAEDEWLIKRLDQFKQQAVQSCRQALRASGSSLVLLDVDQLFDGGTLVMHFLGDASSADQPIVDAIAANYQAAARTDQFAALLDQGCGPDCGTDQGTGCGSKGGCGTCPTGCAVR